MKRVRRTPPTVVAEMRTASQAGRCLNYSNWMATSTGSSWPGADEQCELYRIGTPKRSNQLRHFFCLNRVQFVFSRNFHKSA